MLASIFATILFSVLQLGTVNAADTPDGTCGGTTGWTCTSPEWGSCCSKYGYW